MWITSRPCLTTMRHGITPCITTMCHGLRHASHVDYVTDYVHGLVTDCARIAPLMPSRIASRICRDELLTTNPRPIHDTSPTHDQSTTNSRPIHDPSTTNPQHVSKCKSGCVLAAPTTNPRPIHDPSTTPPQPTTNPRHLSLACCKPFGRGGQ